MPGTVIRVNQGKMKGKYSSNTWFTDGERMTSGLSDLVVINYNGVYFWELKTNEGKMGKPQYKFQDALENTAAEYIVTYGLEEAVAMLDYIYG